ncbi:Protein RAE1 [Zea mays]|uniref:Protein RAE1 n=1 Tax=Zea mays TaxID=4577 RepID=A0A1D6IXT1_MAIZE|nr:Protein RAE1 [Zea mays]
MASLTGLTANPNPNKSFEILPNPGDSVSSLSFSPKSNLLVATSWDNQVALLMLCNLQLAFVTVMYGTRIVWLWLCILSTR